MSDRSASLLATGITFITLAWLTFLPRLYVRLSLLRKWGPDDTLITLSLLFFTAFFACQTGGIAYGTGKHLSLLQPEDAKTALVLWWFCELFYIPAAVFLKLSIGVFLHRIAIVRWHVWVIRVMMVCGGLFGGAYFVLAIFQCKPIEAWWIRKHSLDAESQAYGWCFDNRTVVAVTFASSALNTLADWCFGILPIFIVKDLNMPRKHKQLVAAILSFANIACIATTVRMPYITNLARTDDFLFETVDIAIWSNVEPGIGISAACIATLRPLLKMMLGKRASGWLAGPPRPHQRRFSFYKSKHSRDTSGSQSYGLRKSMPSFRPDAIECGNYIEITAGDEHKHDLETGYKTDSVIIASHEIPDSRRFRSRSMDDNNLRIALDIFIPGHKPYKSSGASTTTPTPTPTYEIKKSVEFTLTEERSAAPTPMTRISIDTTRPHDTLVSRPQPSYHQQTGRSQSALSSHADLSRNNSPSRLPRMKRDGNPPGMVGDPFGAWQ